MKLNQLRKIQKNTEGFTLIELMIVVAIIGILAAIAIPQFSSYRQRAFNSSAESDVRNLKTTEEVLQADHQIYGATGSAATLPGAGSGVGVTIAGPLAPATLTVQGGFLTGTDAGAVVDGIGLGVGNQVYINASTEAAATFGSYVVIARHNAGPRSYATDSVTTAVYYIDDPGMIGANALTTGLVASSTTADPFAPSGTIAATGITASVVTKNWTAQ